MLSVLSARHRILPLSVHTLCILAGPFYGRQTTRCYPYPSLTSAIRCDPSILKSTAFQKYVELFSCHYFFQAMVPHLLLHALMLSVLIQVELASP
jgi:hypothetical protein